MTLSTALFHQRTVRDVIGERTTNPGWSTRDLSSCMTTNFNRKDSVCSRWLVYFPARASYCRDEQGRANDTARRRPPPNIDRAPTLERRRRAVAVAFFSARAAASLSRRERSWIVVRENASVSSAVRAPELDEARLAQPDSERLSNCATAASRFRRSAMVHCAWLRAGAGG
jgi:hypothetical protein